MNDIPRETPEWTPLFRALETFCTKFEEPMETTDEIIFAAQDLCQAWAAYRQARFGAVVPMDQPL